MKKEEYDKKKKELGAIYKASFNELNNQYINESNPHPIGTIIKDHIGIIKVESVHAAFGFGNEGYPMPTYYGTCLTKAMKPRKDRSKRTMWSNNIEAVL